jgi:hypothetical protein
MSNNSDNAGATGCSRRALGIGLLSTGLIGMALGEAIQLALLLSPGALQNDVNLGPYFLSLFLVPISSLPVLISLFLLKVHWLLAIGHFCSRCLPHMGRDDFFPTIQPMVWHIGSSTMGVE